MACGRCTAPRPEHCKVAVGMALTCLRDTLSKLMKLAHIAISLFVLLSVPLRAVTLCKDHADMQEG